MSSAIKINGVSKNYRLGKIGSGYFFLEFRRIIQRLLSPSGTDHQSEKASNTRIQALNDITLTIAHGETIGIIGNNGSGKSTLLKLLAGVTLPTTGTIEIAGRVASLLEIGVGFQSDLSARENIFLNGAILGMSRLELKHRFDNIVSFSGIERFLDTPVKRFSSGMYIRLAFSIAIHCIADILLIDEILAAADRNFLDRCKLKLAEYKTSKTTILIVSHNLRTIRDLCSRTLLIADGTVAADGKTDEIISLYRNKKSTHKNP